MALVFDIKVVTQSGKHVCIVDKTGFIKCFVKSAPEHGKANQEIIVLLANIFKVPKKSVEIIAGLTNRKKKVAVQTECTMRQFLIMLEGGVQHKWC